MNRKVVIKKYNPEEKTAWVKKIQDIMEKSRVNSIDACNIMAKELKTKYPDMNGSKLLATYRVWKSNLKQHEAKNLAKTVSASKASPHTNGNGPGSGGVTVKTSTGHEVTGDPESVARMLKHLEA